MAAKRIRPESPQTFAFRQGRYGAIHCRGRSVWSAIALVILILAPIDVVANNEEVPGSVGPAKDQPVWIVEVNESKPMAYQGDDGAWKGFEVDRLNLIAAAYGHRIDYRPLSNPSDRFQALVNGQADIVIGGNTITAEREGQSIDFTYPTFDSGLAIAVPWDPGKESGSRLMAVAYAYAHWELIPLGMAAFVLSCVFFRQLKRPEVNSVLRGSFAMVALVAIIIMVHADVTTRLQDRDEIIARINGPEDLMGVGVATKQDTTTSSLLPTLGAHVHLTETIDEALKLMRDDDQVEAVVFDSPVLWRHAMHDEHGLRIVGEQFARQKYGLAVHESNRELLEMLNRRLLVQDEQGTTEQVRKQYFGNYR